MTTDEALRELSRDRRNPAAWELIASEVYQPLLSYVASLLLSFRVAASETADDIVHEVLISFYERWTSDRSLELRSATELQSYLRVSCRNLLIDRYRRERRAEQLLNFLTLKFSAAFHQERDLYRTFFVEEIISKMPPKCAEVFELYVIEDLSLADIADRLGEEPAQLYRQWYQCIERARHIFLKRKDVLKRL